MEEQFKIEIEKFGKKVRHLRKERNLTQVDLELLCKINNGDLSRIENGQTNIEFFTIVKLAKALEVELVELFMQVK
jgi:transcriptional regulator with XRE-family HTH domain